MILMRHLLRVIGSRIASSILIVLAILQILTLLDVTTDVLERKLGIAGIASGCAEFAARDSANETMVTILRLVAVASASLVLVGLVYLAANSLWILRSILHPDPTLSEILGSADSKPQPPA